MSAFEVDSEAIGKIAELIGERNALRADLARYKDVAASLKQEGDNMRVEIKRLTARLAEATEIMVDAANPENWEHVETGDFGTTSPAWLGDNGDLQERAAAWLAAQEQA